MNVLSSLNDNINKGCSKQELVYPSKSSVRQNFVELTDRQRRKIQKKRDKEAAAAKRKARIAQDENINLFTGDLAGSRNDTQKNFLKMTNLKKEKKNKSATNGIKALLMNPKDPGSPLSEDSGSLIDEFDEQQSDSHKHFQEITQESKDLYSNIRSEGQVINILGMTSLDETSKETYEFLRECSPDLEGFKPIGEIGHGAHGRVLKLRKDSEKDKVIKLYSKDDEKAFLVEASILANLKRITAGGIGISTFIKTANFYGIIMSAGVGTLADFRDFLKEEKINLTEDELMFLHWGLIRNYAAIRHCSIFHRDIKLGNIILHSINLNLEIIDYSFAVFADPSKEYSGYVGTHGFIAPHIYDAKGKYGDETLLEGDLFSIGITILSMADLNFKLEQDNILKRAKRSLKKISSKKRLFKILESLIVHCKDSTKKKAKSMFPNYYLGYFSGLSKYQVDFERYLERKEILFSSQHEENQAFGLPLKKWKEFEQEQKVAAEIFKVRNEDFKAKNCYELIIKYDLVSGYLERAKPYFYEIRSEVISGKSIYCSPLLYSTLGVYLHLEKNYEGAKYLFQMGLKHCKEEFETLILLNNYAYTCDLKGYCACNNLQSAYNLIKMDIESIAPFVQAWLQSLQCPEQRVATVLNTKDSQRKYELLLTSHPPLQKPEIFYKKLYSFYPLGSRGVINKTFQKEEELILITFLNFCQSKANLIADQLERSNKNILDEIKQFCWSLNQEHYSQVFFQPDFEVLSIILEFHEILIGNEKDICELKELYEEVCLFEKDKHKIYKLIDKEAQEAFFKNLLTGELVTVLIGLIAKFSGENLDNNLSKLGIDRFQKRINILLKFTNTVEMSIQNKRMHNILSSSSFPYEEFFHSNSVLISQVEELKMLQKISKSLIESKFKIRYCPSKKSNKIQWKLIYLSLSVSEFFFETSKLPIIPKTITTLESLRLYVQQGSTFDEKGRILREILVTRSLKTLELEFIRGIDTARHFHNDSAKDTIEFICSFKRLEGLKIAMSDGNLTEGGVKYFEKIGQKLENLKSLTIIFRSCPYITNDAIRSLITAIDTFAQLEEMTLKLEICGNVSMEKVAQYKKEMKGQLKERANIIVQPILDSS